MRLLAATAAVLLCLQHALAQGYLCAEGGGTGRGPWAAEMYGWMAAKGGNGHVVLLGAVELDATDQPDPREAAFVKAGAKSAKSLVTTKRNADTQETYDAITAASIIFIRGGSQSRYVQMWRGTKTEAAIREVFKRGGVVGGTSAGCAILGELSYDAVNGSLHPDEIVKDARHPDLTLTKGYLGFAPGVLFDTHFGERARLPRLMAMLAHAREVHKADVLGVGMDARTALCVSPDGTAEVKGEGVAVLLELSPSSRIEIVKDRPPLVSFVFITIAPAGAKLDLKTRQFITAREPTPARTGGWSITSTEIEVPFTAAPQPAPQGDAPDPAKRGSPEWTRVATMGGGPTVWVVGNPYSDARPVMERINTISCERQVAVMAPPGTQLSFLDTHINIAVRPGATAASSVILDGAHALEAFAPGSLKAASLHRGLVHLLPPGWGVDLVSGQAVPAPLPIPPKVDHSTGLSPESPKPR